MNPPTSSQMMHHLPPPPPPPPLPTQTMNHLPPSRIMTQAQLLGISQPMNHQVLGQINHSQAMNLGQSQAMMTKNRSYNRNPNMNKKFQNSFSSKYNSALFSKQSKTKRSNWKGNNDKRQMNDQLRRSDIPIFSSGVGGGAGGYKPPTLNELQFQNRLKARKFYPKKKFNNRFAPFAPRNTSSYIIRAKKAGGIAELVSPCAVTPAMLPTPMFSPSREVLGDMAKEEWGVDGYGSMKGLIRLRSPGHEQDDNDDEEENASSGSDMEEHVVVERRLDQDLSRFEMVYPNYRGADYNNVLENRVDDQDSHIVQLEEENLLLKERIFYMESEFIELRRRLMFLERQDQGMGDVNEEVVDNESENDSEEGGGSSVHRTCKIGNGEIKEDDNNEAARDVQATAVDEKTESKCCKEETKVDGAVMQYGGDMCVSTEQEHEVAVTDHVGDDKGSHGTKDDEWA